MHRVQGWAADALIAKLAPIQERRRKYEAESQSCMGYP